MIGNAMQPCAMRTSSDAPDIISLSINSHILANSHNLSKLAPSKQITQHNTGHDIKSLAINLFTFLLFMLPFALYLDGEKNGYNYVYVVAGTMALMYIIPPVGWLRPHVYSDFENNKPFPRRND